MPTDALHQELLRIDGVFPRRDESMAAHTPLRVGGPTKLWAVVEDVAALQSALTAARRHKVRWLLHWPLEDYIIRDAGFHGLIIRPGAGFERVGARDGALHLGAASLWSALAPITALPVARWPGSVGGLFSQGEQGRLKGLGLTLRWLKGRRIIEHRVDPGADIPALKPSEIPLDVRLDAEFSRRHRLRPPPRTGQLFTAPRGAAVADLLRRSGLCGARLRSWRLSDVEPGTVVQIGRGTCRDVELLARGVVERVQRTRGVELSFRIPVIGVRS